MTVRRTLVCDSEREPCRASVQGIVSAGWCTVGVEARRLGRRQGGVAGRRDGDNREDTRVVRKSSRRCSRE